MRALGVVAVAVLVVGCDNFEALVERCQAEGRCGSGAGGTGGAAGSGGTGGVAALPPALVAMPGQLTFSAIAGDGVAPQRVTVSNVDGGTAEALTLNFSGANGADFGLTNSCGQALPVGQSCFVDVAFRPATAALGARTATLEIRAAAGEPVLVSVGGSVTEALEVTATLDFGDVTVNTQRQATLSLRNLSTRPVSVVPSVAAPFAVVANGCSPVGASQPCVLSLRFEPATPGNREETLQLDVANTTVRQSVRLTGRGVTPGVLQLLPDPLFTGAEEKVDAGSFFDKVVRVRNNGTQTIGPVGLSVVAPDGGFSLVDGGCGALAPQTECSAVLRFAPPGYGFFPVTLVADAGSAGSAALSHTGRGFKTFNVTTQLMPALAGPQISNSLGQASCTSSCTYRVTVDPQLEPTVSFGVQRSTLVDFVGWTSAGCGGDGGCSVRVNADVTVTAAVDSVPVAFVTSTVFPGGSIGGRAGADLACQRHAQDAGLVGTYVALLGTRDGGSPLTRLPARQRYLWPDGGSTVFGLPLGTPYTRWPTERGVASPELRAFTGLELDGGVATSGTCSDWSSGPNILYGRIGNPNAPNEWWYRSASMSASPSEYYCWTGGAVLYCAGTGRGQPLPLSPPADGGAYIFVATGLSSDGGLGDYDDACSAAAASRGLLPGSGIALLSTVNDATSARVPAFNGPVRRLDEHVVFPSRAALLGQPATAPVAYLVQPDGGLSLTTREVRTAYSITSPETGCEMASGSYLGSAMSLDQWFSTGSYISCAGLRTDGKYAFYCLAFR